MMAERITFTRTDEYMLIGSDSGGYIYRAEQAIPDGTRFLSVEHGGTRQSFRVVRGGGVAVEFSDQVMRAYIKGPDTVDVTLSGIPS